MNYTSMTVAQLREVAAGMKLEISSSLKKSELIALLTEETEKRGRKTNDTTKRTQKPGAKIAVRETADSKQAGAGKKPENTPQKKESKNYGKSYANLPQSDKRGPQHLNERRQVAQSTESQMGDSSRGYSTGMVREATSYDTDRRPAVFRNEAYTQEEFEQLNKPELLQLDSGIEVKGILEVVEGYGFIRSDNYLPGENDVYVSGTQIRRFGLKTGDVLCGHTKIKTATEKFRALLYLSSTNGVAPLVAAKRRPFEELTPIFPDEKIVLDQPGVEVPMRIMDLLSPIGKGQRGMIVSPPKAGKTTLLKQLAKTISRNYEDVNLLVLLIDERPEEVTDIRESIEGPNVEVIYSTFDELPEHHKRVAEMVLDRARRLVELKKDVVILLDSITRLARAYNMIVPPSGRTLSGGLDPAALHMPKKFFGAARNIREGGSLTILATALVETGSKMDDVVFEEFKGTGNMELVLDRKLSERRIFPAIDITRSSTRRDDLLLSREEMAAAELIRREMNTSKGDEVLEQMIKLFRHTKNNQDFVDMVRRSLGRQR